MRIKSSVIQKGYEYFEILEREGYLVQYGTNLTFKNGDKITAFWRCNSDLLYQMINFPANKEKYPKAYQIITNYYLYGKKSLTTNERLIECFEKLEQGINVFIERKIKFSDGHRMYTFISRNINKAYQMISEDQYRIKYSKAYAEILNQKKKIDKVLNKCDEYFKIVEKEGCIVKSNDPRLFSNGDKLSLFWTKNKDKVYSIICQDIYKKKYPKTYQILSRKYNIQRLTKTQRFDEYFQMIEARGRLLKSTEQLKFSDDTLVCPFIIFNNSDMLNYLNQEAIKTKYSKAYEIINNKKVKNKSLLSKEDKLIEFLSSLESRKKRIYSNSRLKFSDGTLFISFVNGYRKYIYDEVSKSENQDKYPIACKIMLAQKNDQRNRFPKMNFIDMLDEYIVEVEKQNKVIKEKSYEQFSNGPYMYYFWYRNIQEIHDMVNTNNYEKEHPVAFKLINDEYDKYIYRLFRKLDKLDIKKQQELIYNVCLNNNIDINLNKKTLDHISYKEFVSKLNFLQSNNCDIINNEGYLDPIFNMSSKHLKVFYDIYINELVYQYFDVKKYRKVR